MVDCSVPGCERPLAARTWCKLHWKRWRRHGDPEGIAPSRRPAEITTCPVRGCDRPSLSLTKGGYCKRHRENLKVRGRALAIREMTVGEYLDHVGFTRTPAGCLEWNGPKNDDGYGIINLARQGLSDARVHREVYKLRVGPLADDVLLRHSCDNPPCSELAHLVPGTHAQNMADMVERSRHWRHGRTTCDEGHDLIEPGATKQYVDGSRCVKCRRRRDARWAASTSRARVS